MTAKAHSNAPFGDNAVTPESAGPRFRRRDFILPVAVILLFGTFGYGAYHSYISVFLSRSLVQASGQGNDLKVMDLLSRGADINYRLESGSGYLNGFWDYLRKNMFVRRRSYKGSTPLMSAVAGHYGSTAMLLLRHGANGVNASNPSRSYKAQFLLHTAVEMRDQELVNALLDRGSDIEVKDYIDCTPLTYAIIQQDLDMVRLLLKRGANPNCRDQANRTVFEYAIHVKMSVEMLSALIDSGADVNGLDQGVWTPLIMAARWGKPGAVELLLKRGAKVNTVTLRGSTALKSAKQANRPEIVEMLVRAGAKG